MKAHGSAYAGARNQTSRCGLKLDDKKNGDGNGS